MTATARLVPEPELLEIDYIDVAAPPERAWEIARRADLAATPLTRALFATRTLASRLRGREAKTETLTIDDIVSSDRPGFRILAESNREVVVGAIGKVWRLDIPFVGFRSAEEFARFSDPGYVKLAWALRVLPRGEAQARIEVELRVAATDDESRGRFRRYFRLVGPGSHFLRHQILRLLARDLGTPEAAEAERRLPGDELLPDARGQMTHAITIRAAAERVWPWLVQMGCRRAGWYSYDFIDNARAVSAKELHAELQDIAVGDVLPATPDGENGFEVLRLEPPRALVLGGLFDPETDRQLPFTDTWPNNYWHVSWAFVLQPLGDDETRLVVRARAAFPDSRRLHALWIRPVHHFMQTAQLRHLKARVEDRMPRDGWHDVISGVAGAAGIAFNLLNAVSCRREKSLGARRSRRATRLSG